MNKKNLEGLVISFNIFGISGKLREGKLQLIRYKRDSCEQKLAWDLYLINGINQKFNLRITVSFYRLGIIFEVN